MDCIIETPNYIYIFEFKLNGTAEQALAQINKQDYTLPYATDRRKLIKVGVSFSSRSGTIESWKIE